MSNIFIGLKKNNLFGCFRTEENVTKTMRFERGRSHRNVIYSASITHALSLKYLLIKWVRKLLHVGDNLIFDLSKWIAFLDDAL